MLWVEWCATYMSLYIAIYRHTGPYGAGPLVAWRSFIRWSRGCVTWHLWPSPGRPEIPWLPYHKEKERFLPWGEHKRLLWPFRGPKGSFKGPRGLPWAPGGSPKSFPWGVKMLQNHYKTCVILRMLTFFCKILNISLEVLQKESMYYSGRFLTGHFCDT